MKKLLFVLLVLCISLTGCNKKEDKEETKQEVDGGNTMGGIASATWDCVEYDTIEKMNKAAGTNIVSAAIAGKSDEWFGVISKNLAQYKFKAGNEEWCVRASKDVDNDISGIYSDKIGFTKDITSTYYTDDYDVFRFFYNNVQYVITLTVPEEGVSTRHFDDVCNEFKTNITGVKSGYEVEIVEEGSNVVIKSTIYNDDATTTIMEAIYVFENDKLTKIVSKTIFETKEAAEDYAKVLIENGRSKDDFKVEGNTIISENTNNVDFYSEYTQKTFAEYMKEVYEIQ